MGVVEIHLVPVAPVNLRKLVHPQIIFGPLVEQAVQAEAFPQVHIQVGHHTGQQILINYLWAAAVVLLAQEGMEQLEEPEEMQGLL
jgi:hypothetical protein